MPLAVPARPSPRTRQTPLRGRLPGAAWVTMGALGLGRARPAGVEALRTKVRVAPPLGTEVSLLRNGDRSGPRVILVHGTPGAAAGWADYLNAPPAGIDLVALDRPGFGASGPHGAVTDLAAQAAAVAALLPDDGRAAVLLGHSYGGAVVARVAAEHPERVGAVVFLAASLDPALESIHPLQHVGMWSPVRGLLSRAIRNANDELFALKDELAALAALLPRIRASVLIVHGTRDRLVPVENVAYLQATLVGARRVTTTLLEGGNHFLPWNAAAKVRAAIAAAVEVSC